MVKLCEVLVPKSFVRKFGEKSQPFFSLPASLRAQIRFCLKSNRLLGAGESLSAYRCAATSRGAMQLADAFPSRPFLWWRIYNCSEKILRGA